MSYNNIIEINFNGNFIEKEDDPIPNDMKDMISLLLCNDPEYRPMISDILQQSIFARK